MDERKQTTWIVPLDGHSFDIEDLPVYLLGSPIGVVRRDDGYYLSIPVAHVGASYEPVLPMAERFVEVLNGAASLAIPSYRPVAVAPRGYFCIDQYGATMNTVLRVGTAECRVKAGHMVIAVNGVPQADSRLGRLTRLVERAHGSTPATDALALLGRTAPTWSELYLVYELVESNTGRRMYDEHWITRTEGTRFTRTANSYTALGRSARHAKSTGAPPPNPMTQTEAAELMRKLVLAWLESPPPATGAG